jgi:hypothetical protein
MAPATAPAAGDPPRPPGTPPAASYRLRRRAGRRVPGCTGHDTAARGRATSPLPRGLRAPRRGDRLRAPRCRRCRRRCLSPCPGWPPPETPRRRPRDRRWPARARRRPDAGRWPRRWRAGRPPGRPARGRVARECRGSAAGPRPAPESTRGGPDRPCASRRTDCASWRRPDREPRRPGPARHWAPGCRRRPARSPRGRRPAAGSSPPHHRRPACTR